MLSDDAITECLSQYGVHASRTQCEQVRSYISLLLKWNRSISLTSVTEEMEILRFHFGESVFALSAVKGVNGRLADVGTGAGFPGLPLRIFGKEIDLLLIESNAKKCAFLAEVVRQLRLDSVRVVKARFEDETDELRGKLHVVVARALGGYDDLLSWSKTVLKSAGRIVIWIGEGDAPKIASFTDWNWNSPILLPNSQNRCILVGSPRNHR
ncbi:MAG: 16S rRNA (guanine(527)-N(7))-methyltransferase RsmG [Terracidiphilus sp.]